jgi:hypothetical protein
LQYVAKVVYSLLEHQLVQSIMKKSNWLVWNLVYWGKAIYTNLPILLLGEYVLWYLRT